MSRVYDLERVLITERVQQSWLSYAPFAAQELLEKHPELTGADVSDEKFRVFPDGSGEVFCVVANKEIRMKVQRGEFALKEE
jgi:hypothetical protein